MRGKSVPKKRTLLGDDLLSLTNRSEISGLKASHSTFLRIREKCSFAFWTYNRQASFIFLAGVFLSEAALSSTFWLQKTSYFL